MDSYNDFWYAKQLQEDINAKSDKSPTEHNDTAAALLNNPDLSVVSTRWELLDPNPDIFILFQHYNAAFFYSRLNAVEVRWSPKMTSLVGRGTEPHELSDLADITPRMVCAGVCVYEGRSQLCSVRLSTPLLKLRPRTDLVETLLDRDGHGPEFKSHMNRINNRTGSKISVYHSFHEEVKLYKQHWWKCEGPCQKQHPFYGMVKRAMNRAPSKNDFWWADHQRRCGGAFVKVHEPEGFKAKPSKKSDNKGNDTLGKINGSSNNKSSTINGVLQIKVEGSSSSSSSQFTPFSGTGQVLGSSSGSSGSRLVNKDMMKNIIEAYDRRNPIPTVTYTSLSSPPIKYTAYLSGISLLSPPVDQYTASQNKPISPDIRDYFESPTRRVPEKRPRFNDSVIILSDSDDDDDEMLRNVPMPDDVNTPPPPQRHLQGAVMTNCPACGVPVEEYKINAHLDACLS